MHPLIKPCLVGLGVVAITLFAVLSTTKKEVDISTVTGSLYDLSDAEYAIVNAQHHAMGMGGSSGEPAMFHSSKRVNQEFIDPIEENGYTCDNGLRTEVYHNNYLKIFCSNATYILKLHIDNEKCSHYYNPGFPPGCKSAWYTVRKTWFKGS